MKAGMKIATSGKGPHPLPANEEEGRETVHKKMCLKFHSIKYVLDFKML